MILFPKNALFGKNKLVGKDWLFSIYVPLYRPSINFIPHYAFTSYNCIFAYIVWVSGFQLSFGFLGRTLREKGTYAFAWELGETSSWFIQEVLLSTKSQVTEDKILRC